MNNNSVDNKNMTSSIIRDLNKIIDQPSRAYELDRKISSLYATIGTVGTKRKTKLETIVIFDLVGSTSLKGELGHDEAMREILLHNKICRSIVQKLNGSIIKELGDGILATFEDPLNACLAAINVKEAANKMKIFTKSALVLGLIERAKIDKNIDVLGTTIDRCSRIEKYAFQNQILIDRALHDAVNTFLMNYDDIQVGPPMSAILKGCGKTELYEISSKNFELKNALNIPFHINEGGRLPFEEIMAFIQNAKSEVIVIGMGLRTLTSYFFDINPSEFKNYIKDLLRKGVHFKCLAVDPNWVLEKEKFGDQDNEYFLQIANNLNKLKKVQNEFKSEKLLGSLEILVYRKNPLFHAVCIDLNTQEGRMVVSNYLYGGDKSGNPVTQFSKMSNPIMFDRYSSSVNCLLEDACVWEKEIKVKEQENSDS